MSRSFLFSTVLVAAPVLCVAAFSSPCCAEPTNAGVGADDNARARVLLREGIDAFKAGKNEEAATALSGAWAIRQTYDVAASLAQAELALKRYRDAAEHLDYCVSHFSPMDSEQKLQQVKAGLDDAKTHVATLKVSVDRAGAEIHIDARVVGTSPLAASVFVEPGAHTLEARLGGDKVSQILTFEAGHEYPVTLRLGVAGVSLSPSPRAANDDRSIVPVIIGGTVAAIGAAGLITFGIAASSNTDKMKQLRAQNGAFGCNDGTASAGDCAAERDAADSHDKNRNLAVASAVVGAIGLVSIPVYWFWPRDDAAQTASRPRGLRLHGTLGIGSVSVFGEF
jgi:hypothetical protein